MMTYTPLGGLTIAWTLFLTVLYVYPAVPVAAMSPNCTDSPCHNGAVCEDTDAGYQCYCVDGYTGTNCSVDFDDCGSTPCYNNATCQDGVASYRCLCLSGFTGAECQIDIDECASSPCLRGGACVDIIGGYVCECPAPYRGHDCSLLPCDTSSCVNDGLCRNDVAMTESQSGFVCDCVAGFTGTHCETSPDACNATSCSGQGICIDSIQEPRCLCEPGFTGRRCQFPINDCISNDCRNNGTCVDGHLGYSCGCVAGYGGALCERELDECTLWQPCHNGATCVDKFNDYTCVCSTGWTGENCTERVNECLSNPCANAARCVDTLDGFTCRCLPFYTGRLCETVYNPCAPDYNQCQHEADCITSPDGKYICFCTTGWTGQNCEVNLNECLSSPCLNNGTCEDEIVGYTCHCATGWEGEDCHHDVDDCVSQACFNGGQCIDLVNAFECECTDDYTGIVCEDMVDYCISDPCYNDGSCIGSIGGFQCECIPPYTGEQCTDVIDACQSQPCHNNGTCSNTNPGFICSCVSPYTGIFCENMINHCASEPCLNGGFCRILYDGFKCVCPPYLTGKQCTDLIDYCQDEPCENNGICINSQDTYRCICSFGFLGNNCEEFVDFCSEVPCQHNADCINVPGGFLCTCIDSYTGELCESMMIQSSSPSLSSSSSAPSSAPSSSTIATTSTPIATLKATTTTSAITTTAIMNTMITLSTSSIDSSFTTFDYLSSTTSQYISLESDSLPLPVSESSNSAAYTSRLSQFSYSWFLLSSSHSRNTQIVATTTSTLSLQFTTNTPSTYTPIVTSYHTGQSSNVAPSSVEYTPHITQSVFIEPTPASTYRTEKMQTFSPSIKKTSDTLISAFVSPVHSMSISPSESTYTVTYYSSESPYISLNNSLYTTSIFDTEAFSQLASFSSITLPHTISKRHSSFVYLAPVTTPFPSDVSELLTSYDESASTHHGYSTAIITPDSTSQIASRTEDLLTTFKESSAPFSSTSDWGWLSFTNVISSPHMSVYSDHASRVTELADSAVKTTLAVILSTSAMSFRSSTLETSDIFDHQTSTYSSVVGITVSPSVVLSSIGFSSPNPSSHYVTTALTSSQIEIHVYSSYEPHIPGLTTVHMSTSLLPAESSLNVINSISLHTYYSPTFGGSSAKASSQLEFDSLQTSSNPTQASTFDLYTYYATSTQSKEQMSSSSDTAHHTTFLALGTDAMSSPSSDNVLHTSPTLLMYVSGTSTIMQTNPAYVTSDVVVTSSFNHVPSSSFMMSYSTGIYSSQPGMDISKSIVSHMSVSGTSTILQTYPAYVTSDVVVTSSFNHVPSSSSMMSYSTGIYSSQPGMDISKSIVSHMSTELLLSTIASYIISTSSITFLSPSLSEGHIYVSSISNIESTKTSISTSFVESTTSVVSSYMLSISETSIYTSLTSVTSTDLPYPCNIHICSNDGTCDSNGTDVVCHCGQRYTGSRCETAIGMPFVQYDESRYLPIGELDVYSSIVIIMSFNMSHPSGLLLAAHLADEEGDDALILFVENNQLKYTLPCAAEALIINTRYILRQYYTYSVSVRQQTRCHATLELIGANDDGIHLKWSSGRNEHDQLLNASTLHSITIGGAAPSSSLRSWRNFTGCIGNVSINGYPIWTEDAITEVDLPLCGTPPVEDPCEDGWCQNGGICEAVTATGQPRCNCQLHYTGTRCENEVSVYHPEFHANGYLQYTSPNFSHFHVNELYLSMTAKGDNGVIVYSASSEVDTDKPAFILLFLEDGMCKYQFSCDGEVVVDIDTDHRVVAGETTDVIIRQTWAESAGFWCTASVTVGTLTFTSSPVTTTRVSQRLDSVYIAGVPANVWANNAFLVAYPGGFQGCIHGYQVNTEEISLLSMATSGLNIGNCDVPVCKITACRNGGVCHSSPGTSWYCDCPVGYGGTFCESKLCETNPCFHGGTCVVIEKENDQLCMCPYGRGGTLCELAMSVTILHFSGKQFGHDSYVSYATDDVRDNIEMRFTFILDDEAAIDNNLIIFMGSQGIPGQVLDYLQVGVYEGHVLLQFDLGSGAAHIWSTEPVNTSLAYHVVHFGRNGQNGWLKVDGQGNSTGMSYGHLTALNVKSALYVGGYQTAADDVHPVGWRFQDSFRGCIYGVEVRVSGRDFRAPGFPPGHVEAGRNVRECTALSCSPSPCHHGAACVDVGASVYCNCTSEWKGLLCNDETSICDVQHSCVESATCLPTIPTGYTCLCPLGKHGRFCEEDIDVSDAMFDGTESYMAFAPVYTKKDIHLLFQTKPYSRDGLLFYMAQRLYGDQGDFLSVALNAGRVELRYDLGDGVKVIQHGRQLTTNSDSWYTVEAGRNATHGYVTVDGEMEVALATGMMTYLDTSSDFYLGGLPDMEFISPTAMGSDLVPFHGCIREFMVNRHRYHLTTDGAIDGRNIGDCDGTACGYDVCKHNGSCSVTSAGGFACACTGDYVDVTCEQPIECQDNLCSRGECSPDDVGGYRCHCWLGWKGNLCDEVEDIGVSILVTSDSYLYYIDTHYDVTNKSQSHLSVSFRTTQTYGMLFWNGQTYTDDEDYLGLGLHNGRLKLAWNLGWFSKNEVLTAGRYNDNMWHHVHIDRSGHVLTLVVDGTEYVSRVPGDFYHLDTNGVYYFGGFKDGAVSELTLGLFREPFDGCLKNFRVYGGEFLSFNDANYGRNVVNCVP